jgi:hypothetical protein
VLRFGKPDQKPDRHDDDGAEQEIAPQPAQDIETYVFGGAKLQEVPISCGFLSFFLVAGDCNKTQQNP